MADERPDGDVGAPPGRASRAEAEERDHTGAAPLWRDPRAAARRSRDVIIVGGGIHGACLALEASRRGLRPLLLERDDFGHATSWNSHRIIHGGLRYLQDLDLHRFRESVAERSWFLRNFPDLVRPLPCLMPLYGEGARRPWVMRLGLAVNHLLSLRRNRGVRQDRRLDAGGVLTPAETRGLFPEVRGENLQGSALWYDALMVDSQRILMEILRWAAGLGAECLNRVEATGLLTTGGRAAGVRAVDRESDEELQFRARHVINAAGPWCPQVSARLDREVAGLFRPSLAFNVLLDRDPLSDAAVAVAPPGPGGQTYFLYPRFGRLYAGTAHAPWRGGPERPAPDEAQLQRFLDGLNRAVPALQLGPDQVIRVYAGLLPTTGTGSTALTVREVIHDHGSEGGPDALLSVVGVKYTTARAVAEKALARLLDGPLPDRGRESHRPQPTPVPDRQAMAALARRWQEAEKPAAAAAAAVPSVDDDPVARRLRALVAEESVLHLDDLLLRRGDWGEDPAVARRLAAPICRLLGWSDQRSRRETERLEQQLPR